MKKMLILIALVANLYSWEINTHRAIDRKAIEQSTNLDRFVQSSGAMNQNYNGEMFDGYGMSYLGYIVDDGEANGISQWRQEFNGKPSYQNIIEAGTILEDAQWSHGWIVEHISEWDTGDGRFVNHFADPPSIKNEE